MKGATSTAIRSGLAKALIAVRHSPTAAEPFWRYARAEGGGWGGALEQRPILIPDPNASKTWVIDIDTALKEDYPEYRKLVGTDLGGGALDAGMLLSQLVQEVFSRYGTVTCTEEQFDAVLTDVAAFFDSPTISYQFYGPVRNMNGPVDVPPILFPGDVTLRPLTDAEFTRFYGGNPYFQGSRPPMPPVNFVLTKQVALLKILGSGESMRGNVVSRVQEDFDRCILALASFKNGGPIGVDSIRVLPAQLVLGAGSGEHHYGISNYVPFGGYPLQPDEAPQLAAHATLFANLHSSLEIACGRLVDSTHRIKPRDAIMDAVIGMESILLKESHTEMRFRFAVNYSTLAPQADRMLWFQTARDMYDVRSKIAHGDSPTTHKIGGEELSLYQAALKAQEMLRTLLVQFLGQQGSPEFVAKNYWVSKTPGLTAHK